MEHLGEDVVLVVKSGVIDFDGCCGRLLTDAVSNGLGHQAGGLPHRVIDDGHLILLIVITPLQVFLNNQAWVVAPDDAVAGTNHLQRQIHPHDFFHLAVTQRAEGRNDIGVVFLSLLQYLVHAHLIVIKRFGSIVLAKAVVAE